MKIKFILILLFGAIFQLNGQNLNDEMIYPDTLWGNKDSVFITSEQWNNVLRLSFYQNDSINWGTYGYKGVKFKIWTDLDTLEVPHVNHPYKQLIKIPVASANDTTVIVLRFQSTVNSNFTNKYIAANRGEVSIKYPETYELANIILFLTECSNMTNNHPSTKYSERVESHFSHYKNHPLIRVLNKKCATDEWSTYYGFRENSVCFSFEGDHLQYQTPYKNVYNDNTKLDGGEFRNILYLVQDFVDKSNFRDFYKNNKEYYKKLTNRQSQLLPLRKMWRWVENEFPQRMDAYKVIASPLIGGSHSTQNFIRGFFRNPEFQECLMFINSSEDLDANEDYTEKLKEGLMSGIVFTEIDHNYVNPTSREHLERIKKLIEDKDFWATKEAQKNYRNEYAIFNEYMTHALFCLYVEEHYEKEVKTKILERRVNLMKRRGYLRFEQFNEIFVRMMKNRSITVYDSYDKIIDKMGEIKND